MVLIAAELLAFMREHPLAVQASVSGSGCPQAAVVGIVVTDAFEVFFDADHTSRKIVNLRRTPEIAFVIGGIAPGDERTVQYEGIADEPTGEELEGLQEQYFESFPDGRQRRTWPEITYVRASRRRIRYTDFNQDPPVVTEFDREQLERSEKK